jgi:hypothetical protein
MAKKIGKINFKQVATNTLTAAASGAIASVLSNAVLPDNPDTVDYAMIAAGIILPEVVKGNAMVESASTALIAVGAYRMSERLDLAGKLGISDPTVPKPPAPAPYNGSINYGNIGRGWAPRDVYASKTKKQKTSGASSVL